MTISKIWHQVMKTDFKKDTWRPALQLNFIDTAHISGPVPLDLHSWYLLINQSPDSEDLPLALEHSVLRSY